MSATPDLEARPRRARPADLEAIERLLARSRLPLDGVPEAFRNGIVAIEGNELIGAAALETYGPVALLRSVAVAEHRRQAGVGSTLLGAVEALAQSLGVAEIYLLTETAQSWFARRGYEALPRDQVPESARGSIEFRSACPETAVAMRRRLAPA